MREGIITLSIFIFIFHRKSVQPCEYGVGLTDVGYLASIRVACTIPPNMPEFLDLRGNTSNRMAIF